VLPPPRLIAVTLAASMLTSSVWAAQTAGTGTGSILGRVFDQTGAVLAHVSIEADSDALIRRLATSTGPDGSYRFASLPPGDYVLSFSARGMRQAEQRVRVALGQVTTLDLALMIDHVQNRVAVVADRRVLDRHSTTVLSPFAADRLAGAPGPRNLLSLLGTANAVEVPRFEVGGGSGAPGGATSVYGVRGWNWPTLEGISISGIFPSGFTLDYGAFQEASVITAGQGPEWPFPGAHTQVITKSGGNSYRGTFYADYESRHWQAFNVDEGQIARGAPAGGGLSPREANRLWGYHDVNADAGGFVVRNRLWWYGSGRRQEVTTRLVNFAAGPAATRLKNAGGKATYSLSPGNSLVVFAQAGTNHQPNRLDPFPRTGSRLSPLTAINEDESSTADGRTQGIVWKAEWNGAVRQQFFVETRVGQFSTAQRLAPHSRLPRFEDAETLVVRGGNREWERSLRRDQFIATASYFHDGNGGSHLLRLGAEAYRTAESETWFEGYPGNVLHLLRNGLPSAVFLFETPSRSEHGLWVYALHGGDSWRVRDRVTLNLGARVDRDQVFLPAQAHTAAGAPPLTFAARSNVIARTGVAPRIGVAYDITGRGGTLMKMSVGRYKLPTLVGGTVNPNTTEWWTMHQWTDSDGSELWEPGEQGTILDRRGGTATAVDPDLRSPAIVEGTAWIEQQLHGHMTVKAGAVWRRASRPILRHDTSRPFTAYSLPIRVSDPGPDGQPGTADDGGSVAAYDLVPELRDSASAFMLRNVEATNEHWTVEADLTRRLQGRWSMSASASHTWNGEHSEGFAGQSVRDNAFPLTPNDLIHTGSGGRHEFRTWTVKAYGTFEAPFGVRLTGQLRHQSGQPFGRTFTAALSYGNVRVLAEPVGTRRMDNVTITDLRVEKSWRAPAHRRLAVFVDVFNLLNANPAQNAVWSSGPLFLRPLTILPPRVARLGAKIDW
jgi:hypothetical protein